MSEYSDICPDCFGRHPDCVGCQTCHGTGYVMRSVGSSMRTTDEFAEENLPELSPEEQEMFDEMGEYSEIIGVMKMFALYKAGYNVVKREKVAQLQRKADLCDAAINVVKRTKSLLSVWKIPQTVEQAGIDVILKFKPLFESFERVINEHDALKGNSDD